MGKSIRDAVAEVKASAPKPEVAAVPKVAAASTVTAAPKAGGVTVTATFAGPSKGGNPRFEYEGDEGKVYVYGFGDSTKTRTLTISE